MAELEKISSFILPNGVTVETVYVRLADGRIVPRRPDELVPLPARPSANV